MPDLTIWVVYDSPTDYPGHYVARPWIGTRPCLGALVSPDLLWIRLHLQGAGLTRLDRREGDDPVIVETWL